MDVEKTYKQLLKKYGPQGWWPIFKNSKFDLPTGGRNSKSSRFENQLCYGIKYNDLKKYKQDFCDPFFEIAIGAILTQNTAWKNVTRAIVALYEAKVLTPKRMLSLPPKKLQELIRSAGYFRQKEKKLRLFASWLEDNFAGDILRLKRYKIKEIRSKLLNLWGIGPETADSIILYVLDRPIFVIDAYTKRLCFSQGVELKTYNEYQNFFISQLKSDSEMFREYHALIVAWGKEN